MKDTKTANWPTYRLLRQSDVVSFFHLQMPQWLFLDQRYRSLSLESKVAYTFLLNRFQLSRLNGWVNEDGEVFIIYPREKLAEEIGISYRKAIACFKELLAAGLIWEHRVGRGAANRIYMAAVELSEDAARRLNTAGETRSAETAGLDGVQELSVPEEYPDNSENHKKGDKSPAMEEVPEPQVLICERGMSCSAGSAGLDMPFRHTNKTDSKNTEFSDTEKVSPSSPARAGAAAGNRGRDRPTDDNDGYLLEDILENCELCVLPEEDAGVFRNVVTRLFYSDSFRVGSAVLPRQVIRSHLRGLDGTVLLDTREKLRRNTDKEIKNSTAYVMTTLLNNIWELRSDLMVDPYLNRIGATT
jgi:hypothetical protein